MADEQAVGGATVGGKNGGAQEAIRLHASDHLGIALVSFLLNGINYLSWSRSVKIALGANMKLSFINGKSERPSEDSKDFEQWQRADYMVTSWIINSISKDIAKAFLYTISAREL
ncbi:UNVERIFIED_CONTAM: hypothetical protein Slati_2489400 [Sesamum latifolium]|uniref:Retrotransposon Copia-like N-terminal domain-containing protein n=1 Tax=Sesamum latifolium TaxID=2727402 RepID=A0AAW2WE83_9LAMI